MYESPENVVLPSKHWGNLLDTQKPEPGKRGAADLIVGAAHEPGSMNRLEVAEQERRALLAEELVRHQRAIDQISLVFSHRLAIA